LKVVQTSPAAVLLAWYLAELNEFVNRWLRRQHQLREELLPGKVRGRLVVTRYVREQVASGRPHVTVSRFFEGTLDNPLNQVLKAALNRVQFLAGQLPLPEATAAIRRQARAIEPFLHEVAPASRHSHLRGQAVGAAFRHYKPILAKSRAILQGQFVGTQRGTHEQTAFLWNSWRLFQEAVRGMLRVADGVTLIPDRPRAQIKPAPPSTTVMASTKVDPDLVVDHHGVRMTLDVKYKEALPGVSVQDAVEVRVGGRSLHVARADVYQAIAYHHHSAFGGPTGLIYPVTLGPGETVPRPHRVMGFDPTVWILFVDVGPRAASNRAELVSSLSFVASQP
jgi:5-methylcytosine-specific restriction enzyme subunit McrC